MDSSTQHQHLRGGLVGAPVSASSPQVPLPNAANASGSASAAAALAQVTANAPPPRYSSNNQSTATTNPSLSTWLNVNANVNAANTRSNTWIIDDDRSDAATIGTSIADWANEKDENLVEDNVMGFDAVKRWALRVNNSTTLTDHAANSDLPVDDLDELVLVAHSPIMRSQRMPIHNPNNNNNNSQNQNHSSSKIDPQILNDFLATLDDTDAEAVCNFIASYRGPNVVSAMYVHLAKIQDLRASEQAVEEMPVKPLDWETLPIDLNSLPPVVATEDDAVLVPAAIALGDRHHVVGGGGSVIGGAVEGLGTIAYGSTTEDGIFSDENDVWAETEGGHSTESDWIILEDNNITSTIPSLQTLPKRALTKILIYSQNPRLLKTSRNLARLPLPTLGSDLAQVILALLPTSLTPFTQPLSSSAASSSAASDFSVSATSSPHITEILTRAAHSPYANRSPLTFPCLLKLAQSVYPNEHVSVETLSAVLDIACKERRWNSVRGVLSLSRTITASGTVGTGFGVVIGVDDLVQQHMRRPFVPTIGSGVGGNAYRSLAANVVANHGKGLNVAFFKDLVEDGGVVFEVDTIRHCSEQYGISTSVVDYLLQEHEKSK
ncbi:UNVERIFIED_CONTAM: hypothetical protein HDU68_003073 [Siphonaria sp. JEL0065]|nr:hypothetical protein HDU68_003073 [Siphonaria sp. JEL0065]